MKRLPIESFEPRRGETLAAVVAKAQQKAIVRALRECGGVRARAARRLGISRSMLYRRMATLDLPVPANNDQRIPDRRMAL